MTLEPMSLNLWTTRADVAAPSSQVSEAVINVNSVALNTRSVRRKPGLYPVI